MSELILVENETTYGGEFDYWQDQTGVTYHYPNLYRGKVVPGKRFLYYRGVRRKNNKQGNAEYFGYGKIGDVWRDESIPISEKKSKWHWFCSIDGYTPFPNPVLSKKKDNTYYENISNALGWRNGVREVSDRTFNEILLAAGIESSSNEDSDVPIPLAMIRDTPIDYVIPIEGKIGIDGFVKPKDPAHLPRTKAGSGIYRLTKRSKQIGDRAEEIAIKWLNEKLPEKVKSTISWIAKEGITPGWDIEFVDENMDTISVEVKGTTGGIFPNVEITAQEWNEAFAKREKYWLVLVANCLSKEPKISLIQDPYSLIEKGDLKVETLIWKLSRI
jgi:hypothetical protein